MTEQELIEITDIKKTKKGKFALFSVDRFLFSVDETVLVSNHIETGSVLTVFELERIRRESDIDKAKEKAFSLLGFKQYSTKQLRDKLLEKYDEYTADCVIRRIEELGYLNDRQYAEALVNGVITAKNMSPKAARNYLYSKGISKEITDELMENYSGNEVEDIRELLERKYRRYDLSDPDQRKNPLGRLCIRNCPTHVFTDEFPLITCKAICISFFKVLQ